MLDTTDAFTTSDGRAIGGTVLDRRNITLRFGGVEAIRDISVEIREGEVRAGIGPNGAGTWSAFASTSDPIASAGKLSCLTGLARLQWRRGSDARRAGRGAGRMRRFSTQAGFGRTTALAILLATPAVASGDVVAEWRDLHSRCAKAVTTGTMLDVSGLEQRSSTMIADVVEEPPFGVRIELEPLRRVPTGIWGVPGGRFEMRVLDFPTRAGVRSICEVGISRGAPPLDAGEASAARASFGAMAARAGVNPRGCPVRASLTADADLFRSSAAELAGAPGCGGPSLAPGGLTRTPASLNARGTP